MRKAQIAIATENIKLNLLPHITINLNPIPVLSVEISRKFDAAGNGDIDGVKSERSDEKRQGWLRKTALGRIYRLLLIIVIAYCCLFFAKWGLVFFNLAGNFANLFALIIAEIRLVKSLRILLRFGN
jgi:hypothetical protein